MTGNITYTRVFSNYMTSHPTLAADLRGGVERVLVTTLGVGGAGLGYRGVATAQLLVLVQRLAATTLAVLALLLR